MLSRFIFDDICEYVLLDPSLTMYNKLVIILM